MTTMETPSGHTKLLFGVSVHLLCAEHPTLEPRHFLEEKAVNEYHQDYMFLECIKFINEVCVISIRSCFEREMAIFI